MLSLLRLAALPLSLRLLLGSRPADAAVQLFVDDPAGFTAATAGYPLLGVEDWSSAGNAPMQAVAAPLEPGVPNPPFPHGTNSETGFLGIVGAPGEIRRVNVWAGGTAVAGADDIRVFAPAAAAAAALAALAWRRRPQADPA